ncbi:MAG: acyclic terpene utilization AtuA family protein [Acidimicrobiia bacterium]
MESISIANCSGFYGDRLDAAREMVEGGPIDVLTGDYLAELTMAILWRTRTKDPTAGYATTFLTQMEQVLGTCLDRGIKVVANAGGLNPEGLAAKLEELADRLGLVPTIAYVEGDDLLPRLQELVGQGADLSHLDTEASFDEIADRVLTANAYTGGWGIATALSRGADVVVTGRVTDASLVVGPAAWRFGWSPHDWDALAGAVVAGHIIECGPQCTGGNYSFFQEIQGLERLGFPIAEVGPDGSSVITKHLDTGGAVTVGTVTAQLLYEIAGPRYLNPDVTARFDTIRLAQEGTDRVLVAGVRGEPPPPATKVGINYLGGFRNTVTLVIPGLDIEDKAEVALAALWRSLGGEDRFAQVDVRLVRHDQIDPERNEDAFAYLSVTVKDRDREKVGRAFSGKGVELALSNYPGFTLTAPPGDGSPYAVYWPAAVPSELITQRVKIGGETIEVPSALSTSQGPRLDTEGLPAGGPVGGPTTAVPLGHLVGARSGDKGGNANVGVWARSPQVYAWLSRFLTVERFRRLIPEAKDLEVGRYPLPNLLAVNFVVVGLLGEGVASSTRQDPQAKTLGEYLRARVVDVPVALLEEDAS